MLKFVFSVAFAAAALTIIPVSTPSQAQGVDVRIGRDRDHHRDHDRRHRSDTTVGISSGGVTVGPRQRCRTVTTTVERDDGRMVKKRERICD